MENDKEMEEIKEFFKKQLEDLKGKKEAFNIFSVLHNEADERRLHSRFIAFLLTTPEFLKLFLKSIDVEQDKFDIGNIEILPSINEKTEYEDIDILISNSTQAIIIENKIYAGDSNDLSRSEDDKYRGQLQRYYYTITDGKNKENKECKKRDVIKVVYLTLDGHAPTAISVGALDKDRIITIDYTQHICNWLSKCLTICEDRELLICITQYKSLITKLTSDLEQAKKNMEIISNNIENAWKLENQDNLFTKECSEIFKHVRWHTVSDFFNELKAALEAKNVGADVIEMPEYKDITKVTHNKENQSQTKLIIRFKYKDEDLYICNDNQEFTLGNLTKEKWGKFSKDIQAIKFKDFSNGATFKLIKEAKRKELIEKIISEMKDTYLKLPNSL